MTSYYKIGCDFTHELLSFIRDMNAEGGKGQIAEVFGSIAQHSCYRARPKFRIPDVAENELYTYIENLSCLGVDFNYTLNVSTLGTMSERHQEIIELKKVIRRLIDGGVRRFTVTMPAIAYAIREMDPDIPIDVSTIAEICSIGQISSWIKLFRISAVCLDISCIRNIGLLKAISDYTQRKNVNIVLIANEFCGHCAGCSVSKCLFRKDCYDLHSLDYTEKELREEDGYPFTECIESRDNPDTPQTWLKMSFIRPEDIFMYEGIGINTFKITGRTTGMDTFRRIVSAYCKGRYDGNLLDLCSPKKTILKNGTVFQDRKPYIENERLNGFVDYWFQNPDHRCAEHECGITCDYCDRFYRERFL